MGEIIICESCHFSFDVTETQCEICLTCLKVLRCMGFARAEKLQRLFSHEVGRGSE
jgi:hypothetical protein